MNIKYGKTFIRENIDYKNHVSLQRKYFAVKVIHLYL